MRIIKMVLCTGISLAIMVAIFYLSAQTSGESGSLSESIATLIASVFYSGFDALDHEMQAMIIESLMFPVRKAAHATEYAALGASLVATCWQVSMFIKEISKHKVQIDLKRNARTQYLLGFALSVLYAISDEAHQLFVDGRSGQVLDVLVDSCGSLIGCTICFAAIFAIAHHLSKPLKQNE